MRNQNIPFEIIDQMMDYVVEIMEPLEKLLVISSLSANLMLRSSKCTEYLA